MNESPLLRALPMILALAATAEVVSAETPPPDLAGAVRQRDALFWQAYNACDVKGMGEFFTDDVEFYHDRGGPTLGHPNLMAALRDRLCGNPDSRLRRELVEGTVRLFPLKKDDVLYGAVLSGEHVFYVLDKGKPERADGRARFTHLWRLEDGAWKMSRILSYDHRPFEK